MKYLKIFTDFKEELAALTYEEKGHLFEDMLNYAETGDLPEFFGNERYVWPTAKKHIDRAREKAGKCAESGRAGGRGRRRGSEPALTVFDNESQRTEATESELKRNEATENAPFLKDNDKDNDKDKYAHAYNPLYPPAGEKASASVPEAERFSPVMQSAVNDWLAYKAEKRQAYRPEGLKAFFAKAESNVRKYGEDAVADAIRQSMAANYQGVAWDKAAGQSCSGDGWTYAQRRYSENDLAGLVIPLDGMGEPSAAMQDDSGRPSDTGEVSAGDRPAPDGGSFAEFWAAYPRRVAKAEAENAWNKLKPDAELLKTMLSAVEKSRNSRQWQEEGGKYIPYPATWLSQRRWEDEPETAANVGRMDNLQRLYAEFEAEAAEG